MDTHAENGGTACTGLSSEQQDCSTDACPAGNFTNLILLQQFRRNNEFVCISTCYDQIIKNYYFFQSSSK